MKEQKKLRIGWFSFTCCEDSSIVFTELLNDHFFEWNKYIEFAYMRILKSKNELKDLDVAFIEGAISLEKDEARLKEIRANCKKLIAVGSCAINGMPSAMRNDFDKKRKKEIEFLIEKFHLEDKVRTVDQFVKVDDKIPGCPMTEKGFLKAIDKCLKEFKIK